MLQQTMAASVAWSKWLSDQPPILEFEHPPHALREFAAVRHHNERHAFFAIQFDEQLAEVVGAGVIERAGGFVGEEELRLVDERADDGDALAFAAGELAGEMMQPFRETDALEQALGALGRSLNSSGPTPSPSKEGSSIRLLVPLLGGVRGGLGLGQRRHEDVFPHGALREEEVGLEHEADLPIADGGELEFVELTQISSSKLDAAGRGLIERADDLQQRALAGTGRSHDSERFAGVDLQRKVIEHGQRSAARRGVAFGDA